MVEPQLGMSMDQLVETARLAEELRFGYFFRSDHILPTNDKRGMASPECWTSLGAIAASTKQVKFGPLVTPIGFRSPALLARMACTLHSFSGGRLQLSVGAGWYEAEYRAHGFPFPDFRTRRDQFREALHIITAMVHDGEVDFDGKFFSAHTDCYPRPYGDLHIIVGARTKSLVKLAGTMADEWNSFSLPTEVYQGLREVLTASADGRKVEVSTMTPYMVGKTQSDLEASARLQAAKLGQPLSPTEVLQRLRNRNAPCGTAEDFVEKVREIHDSGVQRIYFQTLVPENRSMVELLRDTLAPGV
jgi:alkanesulfonate monooxygenase SsuD/methylene tetrahydromethanopterin reductase-like flavin-dependent oxidoreductase (luciferase family)